ncbi:MAG: transposase [Micavibrio sp.]|nr:transposase [Micavibrio sp.]
MADLTVDNQIPKEIQQGEVLTSPKRRCEAVIRAQGLGYSERQVCRALGQNRGALRKPVKRPDDEETLTKDIIRLATKYGRYGYKRIAALRVEGWRVNHKRVERIWRQEARRVPQKKRRGPGVWK